MLSVESVRVCPLVRLLRSALATALVFTASGASASGLYLNEVKVGTVDVSGVEASGLKFENAKVRIDDKGNLFIDVKGYAIKVEGAEQASSTTKTSTSQDGPARLTRRYFLVTEQVATGMTDYDIDLFINSKWVRKLRSNDEQVVTEVTKWLQPGSNSVLMTAKKLPSEQRRSHSPDHVFRVIIGEGNASGDNVMIDNPVVTFKRTAADVADVSQEFTFTTR